MDSDKKILELIKTTACKCLPDAEVLLFGSRARKDTNPDSDYDILVVTNEILNSKRKISFKNIYQEGISLNPESGQIF